MTLPENVGTASAGVADEGSREDHAHGGGGGGGGGGTGDYDDLTNKPIDNISPPAASAETDDVLQWDAETKQLARTILHHGTSRTVTWERLPVDETLAAHGTYSAVTYKGVVGAHYPATVTNADAWFVRLGSEWIQGVGGHWVGYLPPDGIGEF